MSSLERIPRSGDDGQLSLAQTTCAYCGVGCGVDIALSRNADQTVPVSLSGTPEHPANFGRLCVKGSQLLNTLDQTTRLLRPEVDGQEVEWSQAIHEVAARFGSIINEHGPNSVALYVSGQLLTEDYYVANKLMKGYIGSANIDTNSRLCMSSAVAAQKRAFGSDAVPCSYEDLELSELIVFVGSNAAWTHPVLFQRVERAKQLNPSMKVVVIDPRETATCSLADLHLQIGAGTDVALFNGLLNFLSQNGGVDPVYVRDHVDGFDGALDQAKSWNLERTANVCGLSEALLKQFYSWFCHSKSAMSFYSMGVNQSSSGVDKANSIINCHLASGKIGKPGSAPFSITGQPNAMGGREVGGLANLLAAHMDIDNAQHREMVQDYWQSPKMVEQAGQKAVDLFQAIESGEIKAVWIMATNPLVSMPNRNQIERALKSCECVVVSEVVSSNDTLAYADIKLPATAWSEKDGTVTNSERMISRQRSFLPAAGQARHDWRIICDVAKAMGFGGFEYENAHQIFTEYAGLTAYRNDGSRDLDLSALTDLSLEQYDRFKPLQWPVTRAMPSGTKRLFEDGRFFTASGKANCIAVQYRAPAHECSDEYPFVLNSGRLRDQWHTMTRSGISASLNQHSPESYLAIHPDDARAFDLFDGDFVSLSSAVSLHESRQVILPVRLDNGQRQGELFAPIHWGKEWASSSSIAYLYRSDRDEISGQPELKHTAVSLSKCTISQHACLLVREPIDQALLFAVADVWSKIKLSNGFAYRISNVEKREGFAASVASLLEITSDALISRRSAQGEVALFMAGKDLSALLIEQGKPVELKRSWYEFLLSESGLSTEQVHAVLHGKVDDVFAQGKVVCSCYQVGENAIRDAIETKGCTSVEALGATLKCGTNCGSCKSELKQMLRDREVKTISLQVQESVV